MVKKTSMCVCPKCGGDDIEYLDMDYEDELIIHKCVCNKCELVFSEYEKTVYDGYSYDDEDGEYHDFDANGDEIGK